MAPSTTGKYNWRGELNGLWAARPLNSTGPLYSFGQPIATRVDGALYCVHRDRVQHDPYAEVITALPLPLPQSVLQYHGIGDGARVSPILNKGGTAYENPTKPLCPADS